MTLQQFYNVLQEKNFVILECYFITLIFFLFESFQPEKHIETLTCFC